MLLNKKETRRLKSWDSNQEDAVDLVAVATEVVAVAASVVDAVVAVVASVSRQTEFI